MTTDLFHLAVHEDWEAAAALGVYEYSTRGLLFEQVGFVHCSYAHQLTGVANRFYSDCPQVLVLVLDTEALTAHGGHLIEEPAAEDSTEMFPHLYGAIPLAAVREVRLWDRNADGVYLNPPVG
jgi:glutathione S-transferase